MGLILLSTGCYNGDLDDQAPVNGRLASFYDLKGFFSKEINRLDRQQPEGMKTVRFEGKSETIDMKAKPADYGKELASFIASDINKPSWREKYRIDTASAGSGMQEIRYTALDEHLKTREIQLLFNGNSLKEVRIKNRLKSIIAESTQTLSYRTGSGYTIEGVQGSPVGRGRAFSVSVVFNENGGEE
ncbi:MAG: hypothetical protein KIPDCIKN_00843 [Haliscomenobacter sp.]|nr:hypothetical protein [Haliscomenobacter sp.]